MIMKLFGIMWAAAGVYILVRPGSLLLRIRKRGLRQLRRYLMAATLFLSGTLIAFGLSRDGLLSRIILVVGVIGIFKAFALLHTRVAERLTAWSARLPDSVLRLAGVCYIAVGAVLYFLRSADSASP
jgi:uncharacterized protein YjeT (DUF2065 family)